MEFPVEVRNAVRHSNVVNDVFTLFTFVGAPGRHVSLETDVHASLCNKSVKLATACSHSRRVI
eukprot:6472820-Karenia_brevis.AAC.1